jgi:hypothetical protein
MIDFLPEREDMIMSFDTAGHYRVFVSEHHWNENRWQVEVIDLNDNNDTVLDEECYNDEQTVYQIVSEFLANK